LNALVTLPPPAKILLVDDDEAMLDLAARWLAAAGYWVTKAHNGEEAAEVIDEEAPAAIIMDLTMPRMDGFQVLAKFRVRGLPLPPVLMLTGRHSADDVRKAVSLGVKDYLVKPVNRDQLLSRLERLLPGAANSHADGALGPENEAGRPDHYLD
jgi:DNA-binding response OmpR family regulator